MSFTYEVQASRYAIGLKDGSYKFPIHPIAWGLEIEQFDAGQGIDVEDNCSSGIPLNVPPEVIVRSLQAGYEAHRDGSDPWEFKIHYDTFFLNLKKKLEDVIGKNYWKWGKEIQKRTSLGRVEIKTASSHCHASVLGPIRMPGLGGQMVGTPGQWTILANTLVTFVPLCLPWFVFGKIPRHGSLIDGYKGGYSQPVTWRYSEKEVLKIFTELEEPMKWIPSKKGTSGEWGTSPVLHNYCAVSWNRKNKSIGDEAGNPPKKSITLEIRLCEQHPYWIFPWMQCLTKISRQSMVHDNSVKLKNSEETLAKIYELAISGRSVWDCLKRSPEIEFLPKRGIPNIYSNDPSSYKLHFNNALDVFRRVCVRFAKSAINSPIEYGRIMRMYADGIDFDIVNRERPELLWDVRKLYDMCYGEHASDEHARRWLSLRDVEVDA